MFGFNTTVQPDRNAPGSNKFNDLGVDASYQFLGTRKHVGTVNTSFIRERQINLNQLFDAGESANLKGRLNEFKPQRVLPLRPDLGRHHRPFPDHRHLRRH